MPCLGPRCPQSGPVQARSLAAGCGPTPDSQRVALEGCMVQQGKALAVGSSDINAWHLGEDLHNATGTGAR